jgi:hypothetical protein
VRRNRSLRISPQALMSLIAACNHELRVCMLLCPKGGDNQEDEAVQFTRAVKAFCAATKSLEVELRSRGKMLNPCLFFLHLLGKTMYLPRCVDKHTRLLQTGLWSLLSQSSFNGHVIQNVHVSWESSSIPDTCGGTAKPVLLFPR